MARHHGRVSHRAAFPGGGVGKSCPARATLWRPCASPYHAPASCHQEVRRLRLALHAPRRLHPLPCQPCIMAGQSEILVAAGGLVAAGEKAAQIVTVRASQQRENSLFLVRSHVILWLRLGLWSCISLSMLLQVCKQPACPIVADLQKGGTVNGSYGKRFCCSKR